MNISTALSPPPFASPTSSTDVNKCNNANEHSSRSEQALLFLRKNHQCIPIISTVTGIWNVVKFGCFTVALAIACVAATIFSIMTAITALALKPFLPNHSSNLGKLTIASIAVSGTCFGGGIASSLWTIGHAILSIPIVGNVLAYAGRSKKLSRHNVRKEIECTPAPR
jgi:hypothetical protein